MRSFVTGDGVSLAYEQSGVGDPLVLVHGGATTHRCFDAVVDLLAASHMTVRYDRRGHGASAAATTWSLGREVEDLLEVAELVGEGVGVRVLGYSFGATVALQAAGTEPSRIRGLVAYEPPYGVPGLLPAAPRVLDLLAEDRRDEAARLFVTDTFHLGKDLVERMTAHPMWEVTLEAVKNLRHELPVVMALDPPSTHQHFPPTRVLVAELGGNPAFHDIAAALQQALGSHTATVPGVPHFAMATAPQPFVAAAMEHLDST